MVAGLNPRAEETNPAEAGCCEKNVQEIGHAVLEESFSSGVDDEEQGADAGRRGPRIGESLVAIDHDETEVHFARAVRHAGSRPCSGFSSSDSGDFDTRFTIERFVESRYPACRTRFESNVLLAIRIRRTHIW